MKYENGFILCLFFAGNFSVSEAKNTRKNIAKYKPSFSSSYWLENHLPKYGNDGREDADGSLRRPTSKSCSWTTSHYDDMEPWWAVDLGRTYHVKRVGVLHMITYSKPSNLIIEMFQTLPGNNTLRDSGKLCIRSPGYLPARYFAPCRKQAIGRYLRVKKFKLHHSRDVFAVCEYFVYGVPVPFLSKAKNTKKNIAKYKPSFSSSYWLENHLPKYGNDGREDADGSLRRPTSKSCSWTTSHYDDMEPWWAVDLGRTYHVKRVGVLHMITYSKPSNLIIELFQTLPGNNTLRDSGKLCIRSPGYLPARYFAPCRKQAIGRYLRVKKFKLHHSRDVFAVCEYFVYGVPVPFRKPKKTPQDVTSSVTLTENKTNHLLTTKEQKKRRGPSLFSCLTRNNSANGNEKRNMALCNLPFESLPQKFQKRVDDIQKLCREIN